ncbi:hypothetical protein OUZ56_010117 [Daphnia magna]|uniref:Uncharacterized protein n=1 Tax=Daphnia magna TaxID=35525 RepID=A0ABR0AHV8_9CRUS|nr:hypothetical protein OUZ56_010117 [Daphnia magna]
MTSDITLPSCKSHLDLPFGLQRVFPLPMLSTKAWFKNSPSIEIDFESVSFQAYAKHLVIAWSVLCDWDDCSVTAGMSNFR